ncbi:MAG: D-alanyl-D-alanine carboxypeptidase [Candidatus Niyogibacteria bacterium]|nr:D-alanyl-D-alanine carboxypeptidase [Candidatus Niyogibacteria bacterium]
MKPRPVLYSFILFLLIWNVLLPERNSASQLAGAIVPVEEKLAAADPFQNIDLEARAYLIFDFASDSVVASRNAELKWPLASLAKLMTAVVAEENILSDDIITVSKEAILEAGDDSFLVGEQFKKDTLRDIMMIQSSNDAAYALAEHLGIDRFVALMNQKAVDLGLKNTSFTNSNGLDILGQEASAYASARDLMILMKYILENHSKIFDVTRGSELSVLSEEGRSHKFMNTDRIVNDVPELIGGKTGFTDIAGGNLAIVVDIGIHHPVGMVVFGSSEEGRFSDMLKLYKTTIIWFQNK